MGKRWRQPGGFRDVLQLAVPLIISTSAWGVQHFIDRMFLSWYSREAVAAAMPAGMLNFMFASFFLGTIGYVNTFVAQYTGADKKHQVGAVVWQGVYFSILAGVTMLALMPFSDWFFELAGHEQNLRSLESEYFRISCFLGPSMAGVAFSAFFSGRGKTLTVMWVNVVATGINIALDYAWIFGNWGFPEWGIQGAAWATVVAHYVMALIFFFLVISRRHRKTFNTLAGWRLDWGLFKRLIRFGVPNGTQFMLDITAFTMFIMLIGRLGSIPLTATNITFTLNVLAFLPLVGMGMAVSTLVGQYIGKERPELAERTTYSACILGLGYMVIMAIGYVFFPSLLLAPFSAGADPVAFAQTWDMCIVLLRFVAVYCIFDAMYIVFSAAVKGAGDTRFVMWTTVLLAWGVMVVPSYLAVTEFGFGLYGVWIFICSYICIGGVVFLFRFRGGKWKSMRVIEREPSLVDSDGDRSDLASNGTERVVQ
jgi:MATE family multidrug resistance protein